MKEKYRKCSKCGRSAAQDPSVKLFRFPLPGLKNSSRCQMWAKFLKPEEAWESEDFHMKLYRSHVVICDKHFEDKCFIKFLYETNKKQLFSDAVPTLEENSTEEPMQVEPVLSDITNIPQSARIVTTHVPNRTRKTSRITNVEKLQKKCRKYTKRICALKNSVKKIKAQNMLNLLSEDVNVEKLSKRLTPSFALMLQGQLRNTKRKPTGHRWTQEENIVALRIYKRSPTAYRLLRRMFVLPSPSTLKKILSRLELRVGINEKIFDLLKNFAATLEPDDNNFTLMFDEISIRKNLTYNIKDDVVDGFQDHGNQGRTSEVATHALVFMIAGIRRAVKQPIAYYISGSHVTADRLSVLIKEVVAACFESNINIRALVCDMNGVNVRAFKLLGALEENPKIVLNNKELITMFNTPHLLKCFRNCFMKYNIQFSIDIQSGTSSGIGIAKWDHIKQFYEVDSNSPIFVHAPGLTLAHLEPNSKQKMRVNLAAQALSHSVASGIYCKVSSGELPSEAIATANIISDMDKLFDMVNACSQDCTKGKPWFKNMTKSSLHEEHFRKMRYFFKHLQCYYKKIS